MQVQPQQKKWIIKEEIPESINAELEQYHPLLRKLLYHRGCLTKESAEAYLSGKCSHDSSPFLLSDMESAVDRIFHAIKSDEKIAIYGDYDADGITSTALLVSMLNGLGAKVNYHIPDRFEEGYGLNIQALDKIKEQGVGLLITVDNGIRSINEVEYATDKLKMDVIITDHHHPRHELPRAIAVIDPKKDGDSYPFKEFAGVGIAYKLIEALCAFSNHPQSMKQQLQRQLTSLVDLVALGTVADVVPLISENRVLVKQGLEVINNTQKVGLNALIDVSRLKKGNISSYNLGFVLGPRINAAGRIDNAIDALKLLIEEDEFIALNLAQRLEYKNSIRKIITDEIIAQAEELIVGELDKNPIIFAYHEKFNSGVVGLAAAKLAEKYYRPAIIGELKDDFLRASCRSIPEFHITEALDECMDLFVRHGGHASAAGFTIHKSKIDELNERLQKIAFQKLSFVDLVPRIYIDEEVDFSNLPPQSFQEYYQFAKLLEPTGQQNDEALFVTFDVPIKRRIIFGENNLRLTLKCKSWVIDAVGFGMGNIVDDTVNLCDIVYTIGVDNYHQSLYLRLKDIRPSSKN